MLMCADRLDDVTADAELQEKSAADVKFIVDMLLSQCSQAVREHEEKMKELTVSSTAQTDTQPAAAERTSVSTSPLWA